MGIKDPDVRRAMETLQDEFENLEASVSDKDEELENLQEEYDKLEARCAVLEARVEELEEALAEAYLTSEADGADKREDD